MDRPVGDICESLVCRRIGIDTHKGRRPGQILAGGETTGFSSPNHTPRQGRWSFYLLKVRLSTAPAGADFPFKPIPVVSPPANIFTTLWVVEKQTESLKTDFRRDLRWGC